MLLDVLLTNADKLIKEVKIGGTLAFSGHTLVDFKFKHSNANMDYLLPSVTHSKGLLLYSRY